jgi:hypothetical protein
MCCIFGNIDYITLLSVLELQAENTTAAMMITIDFFIFEVYKTLITWTYSKSNFTVTLPDPNAAANPEGLSMRPSRV